MSLSDPIFSMVLFAFSVSATITLQKILPQAGNSLKGEKILMAIDVGSSSVRCCAFRVVGGGNSAVFVPDCTATHKGSNIGNGMADCEQICDLINQVVKRCLCSLQQRGVSSVHSLGITSFAMTLLGVDADTGAPATPVFTYAGQGPHVNAAAEQILSEVPTCDLEEHYRRTGTVMHHPSYATAQLKSFLPSLETATATSIAGRALRWTTLSGFLLGRWTGLGAQAPVSLSEAAWTGLLDVEKCQWDGAALRFLGLHPNQLPPLDADLDNATALKREMEVQVPGLTASEGSLLRDTTVHAGIGDGFAATIASRCSLSPPTPGEEGTKRSRVNLSVTIGTSAAVRFIAPSDTLGSSVRASSRGLFEYRVSRRDVLVGGALTDAGSLIAWYTSLVGQESMDALMSDITLQYSADLAALLLEAPLVLPFWSGERSTGWHGEQQGSISGLTQGTSSPQVLIALLVGVMARLHAVVLEVRAVLGPFCEGIDAIVGSGAVLEIGRVWRQMLADILNLPVVVLKQDNGETTINGLALHMLDCGEQQLAQGGRKSSADSLFGFERGEVEEVNYPIEQNHQLFRTRLQQLQRLYTQREEVGEARSALAAERSKLAEKEQRMKGLCADLKKERAELVAERLQLHCQVLEHAAEVAALEVDRSLLEKAMLLARSCEYTQAATVTEEVAEEVEKEAMRTLQGQLDSALTEQVEFVKNKAELSPAGLQACKEAVPILLSNPSIAFCIDGHTNCFLDTCRDHCLHVLLSQQRVDAVKEQLKAGGAHNNIFAKGWGCKHPEVKNERAVRIYPAPKHALALSKMTSL